MRFFARLSLVTQFTLLLLLLLVTLAVAASVVGRALVVSQTLNESRSVADMAEHIGTWGSRYGGVAVRVTDANRIAPGTYLERYAYAVSPADLRTFAGARLDSYSAEMQHAGRTEAYYSKNPALIQREISDIAAESPSRAKFRMTARTVLNPNNAPTPFELEAIDAIEGSGAREYKVVKGNQLLYARSLVAAGSCLRCHGEREAAPAFIRANAQFNGGGGFGYREGRPAGIISVSIPLPATFDALAGSLSPSGWAALLVCALTGTSILVFVARRVIAPVNRLRAHAEALASTAVSADFQVPPFGRPDPRSRNEVDRLALAIGNLGASVRVLFDKVREARRVRSAGSGSI